MITNKSSDQVLLKACLKNQRRAQELLFKRYYPYIMPVCMSYMKDMDDALEACNLSMLKVFQSLDKYTGNGVLGAWIRRIVVNTCIDRLRSQVKYNKHLQIDEAIAIPFSGQIISNLSADEILNCLQELPNTYRLVVNMSIVEGFSHKEIAKRLSISEGTSKWYLSEGRKMLRKKLEGLGIINSIL